MTNQLENSGLDADDRAPTPSVPAQKPAGVYIIAIFFTAMWLYSLGSILYVLFVKFTPEMRHQAVAVGLLARGALATIAIAEINGFLMMLASWFLVAMRRIGAGLMLASTVLVAGLCAISWPPLLHQYSQSPTHAGLHALLLGGSNLMLHIAAAVYAFRLNSKGLLR